MDRLSGLCPVLPPCGLSHTNILATSGNLYNSDNLLIYRNGFMFQRLIQSAVTGAVLCAVHPALAVPYVPSSDAQVLEKLPFKPGDPAARELRALRAALQEAPHDPVRAEALARRYFDLAMAEGDPRYIGYAEAALRSWNSGGEIPPELRIVRALLRQYRHDFAGALEDLASAPASGPAAVEIHAWRAAIFMVQARYPEARRECASLAAHASALISAGCMAYVDATTGHARVAYETLESELRRNPGASATSRLWILTRLAEMAQRLKQPVLAEQHYRAALGLGITDNFLLAAYADFLLEESRPGEVADLLRNWARSDTLLLRLALAEKTLGSPSAARHIQALEDRFSESALRGEQLHLQEEARFRLHLKADPRGALGLAVENWKAQREPRDAAILLEAAIAAHEPAAAKPAADWMAQSGFESATLHRLVGQLGAASR